MTYDKLRAIILANPTEPPTRIAERIDVPAWRVKDARKELLAIGAVPRLAKVNGPITDADCAAIIEMRRAGHSITAIKDHFSRAYSVVFRIIAAATRAGQIATAKRIVPIKPNQATKARTVIGDEERAEIIALRRAGMTQPQIRERTGRGLGSIFDVLQAAIKAGELQPIKRMRPGEPESKRGGLGDAPAPAPRACQVKEPPCRWALSLMARGMSEIKAREQARLDRHKRKLEPWEGAGPFHS
jgi:transposase